MRTVEGANVVRARRADDTEVASGGTRGKRKGVQEQSS